MINIAAYTEKGDNPGFLSVNRRLADGWVTVTVRNTPKLLPNGVNMPGDVAVIDIPPADWTKLVRRYMAENPHIDWPPEGQQA